MVDPLEELREAARAALPPVEGRVAVPGLSEPVEVLRDRWGIAYLSASTLDDLWFAQGYVQASERLFQIELVLRAAGGRLSEWFSDLTVQADRFARTIGFHRIGDREAERWNDASISMMVRFVEGARAWIASMPAPPIEYAIVAAAPELPSDLGPWAAAFAYVAWGLSGNWDRELMRHRLAERLGPAADALLPPLPAETSELAAGSLGGRLLDGLPRSLGQGSNAWAVAGSRTASGRPLLANDPHLLTQQPAPWFELHLRAPGYVARGVTFPFCPGIVIATTPHHAWGLTNASGDVQDLYIERLNADRTAALMDGAWEPLTVRSETIEVRGGPAVAFEVRQTRHGPILESATVGVTGTEFEPLEGTFAIRWTASDGLLEPSALVEIVRASSFEEFRMGLRGLACPGQNVVYADIQGTIAYQCTGRYPIRRTGDGSVPVPGWTSDNDWDGYIPYEKLPWSKDPESGFIVTANNRMHDEDYPHLIGVDLHPPFRARRIAELLGAIAMISPDDARAMQIDTVSLPARRLLPRLLPTVPRSRRARQALQLLEGWDGDLRADSVSAAIYEVWVSRIAVRALSAEAQEDPSLVDGYLSWREPFVCIALPTMLDANVPPPAGGSWETIFADALEDALDVLHQDLGPERAGWRWGALHRVRFAHPFARMPGLGSMFVASESELGGDEQTILQGAIDAHLGFDAVVVPSWRVVVDLGSVDGALAILATGQSGNPMSPHWNDQSSSWEAGRLRPCPLSRAAVEAAAQHRLMLVPG